MPWTAPPTAHLLRKRRTDKLPLGEWQEGSVSSLCRSSLKLGLLPLWLLLAFRGAACCLGVSRPRRTVNPSTLLLLRLRAGLICRQAGRTQDSGRSSCWVTALEAASRTLRALALEKLAKLSGEKSFASGRLDGAILGRYWPRQALFPLGR